MSTSENRRSAGRKKWLLVAWAVFFLAGLGIWIISLLTLDPGRAWRALLVNFNYFTPLAAGLVTWTAIVIAANGKWSRPFDHLAAGGLGFALPSLLALGALWLGWEQWLPWIAVPQPKWLRLPFYFIRDFLTLTIFWVLAAWYLLRRNRDGGKIAGVWLVIVYGYIFSLLGFDLVMAMDPRWHSTLFGGYYAITGLYIAVAAWALMAAWQPAVDRDRLHDLGNLVLAFAILSTYLMFAQLLPIWYENLPPETRYVLPRLKELPWVGISVLLLMTIYLGPLVFLLTIWSKRNRWFLGGAALVILFCQWLERNWLIQPQFAKGLHLGLTEFGTALGFLGAMGLSFELCRRWLPMFTPREKEGSGHE